MLSLRMLMNRDPGYCYFIGNGDTVDLSIVIRHT